LLTIPHRHHLPASTPRRLYILYIQCFLVMAPKKMAPAPKPKTAPMNQKVTGVGYGATEEAPTQEYMRKLMEADGIHVKERINKMEALVNIFVDVEFGNKYDVFTRKQDGSDGEKIFFVAEETDFCHKQLKRCFPDCIKWDMDILYTLNDVNQKVMHLERPSTCTCCCFNRPEVFIKDVEVGKDLGSINDPFACCDLTFTVFDPNKVPKYHAKGGCCQLALICPCFECCCPVKFSIEDDSGNQLGEIIKTTTCMQACLGEGDNYEIDYAKVKTASGRAMLMALTAFIDMRYFTIKDNGGD